MPVVRLLQVDNHVVVVDKPSGIATVPYEDEPSLVQRVAKQLAGRGRPRRLHVVQRLDLGTSGVLVFARTELAREVLKAQLRAHTMERVYLAIAHGKVSPSRLESRLVADRGDRRRGSTKDGRGRLAVTHVEPVEALRGATLVACRLETGRTHQVRIQLAEAGHPLLGERVYVKGHPGRPLPSPRLALHATRLAFDHPSDGTRRTFHSPLPPDLAGLVASLRL